MLQWCSHFSQKLEFRIDEDSLKAISKNSKILGLSEINTLRYLIVYFRM